MYRRRAGYSVTGALWVFLMFAFLYLPIVIFFIFSFNDAPFPARWVGFTFKWYTALMSNGAIWQAVYNSLLVASISVLLSVCMSIFLLYFVSQSERAEKLITQFYANTIFPEIVLAVGLLSFYTYLDIPLGMVTLIMAHTVIGLGYIVPLLHAQYAEMDIRLTEAALDLGATPFKAFFSVTLPLLKPALLSGSIMAFIVSFDDFVLAYFCSGSTFQTFPLYVLSMLRVGLSPVVNAASTVFLVCSSILIVVYSSFKNKNAPEGT